LLAPIILLEGYLACTVLMFFFGPVDWDIPNVPKLVAFLVVNYGGLWLGYRWGIKRGSVALSRLQAAEVGVIRVPRILLILIVFSMVFAISGILLRVTAIRGGLTEALSTLLNPGQAYLEAQVLADVTREGGKVAELAAYSWAFRITTVLSVFNSLYLPLVLICWRQIGIVNRILFVLALLCTLGVSFGIGTQSGIGFSLFACLPVLLYKIYVAEKPLTVTPLSKSGRKLKPLLTKIAIAVLIAGFVGMVAFFQVDRREVETRELDPTQALVGDFGVASTRGLVPITGTRANYGLVMACLYMSHGYEGLALSMELPFEWSYGIGWSKALQSILHDYLGGPDLFESSYMARNEAKNGWSALRWWSTIFPWLASDTTFYGTVLFMVLIGFVIGRCWVNIILTGNPMGFAVLAQMFILVFMFPANNALAQTLDAFFGLIGVSALYMLSWRFFTPVAGMHGRRLSQFPKRPGTWVADHVLEP